MEYRMWKCTAAANENCVPLIKESIKKYDNINVKGTLGFIGFEAPPGTEFYLNDSKEAIEVPSCGSFITPFDGQRGVKVWSLKFKTAYTGNIYYVIQ